MRLKQRALVGAIIALLVIAAFGMYWTGQERAPAARTSLDAPTEENETSLTIAQRLIRLPTTADELPYAQEALRLADQEMDLAFANAVREAAANPQPMTKRAQAIQARLRHAQQELSADSALVAKPAGMSADQLDLAKVRLELDQDEVDDARDDLIHAGGDPQGRMQAMIDEHKEESRNSDSIHIKVTALVEEGGLVQTAQALSMLRAKDRQVQQARASAESASVSLAAEHKKLEDEVANAVKDTVPPTLVEAQRRALEQKARSSAGKRDNNQRRLARIYTNWLDVLHRDERALVNRGLRGIVKILAIVVLLLFTDVLLVRALTAMNLKRRSAQRLRVVSRVSLQALGVLLILIVIFGTPNNLGTIIGLAGAGLTVALKDFIVSFVGWLVLMGKHGIRIGDLVEINSVTGEVVELGMFNTVLHETGNWTDSGHPTGRRVTFTNSYAVEGHYFNFSTSGQWMWDEVRIAVPAGKDPYPVVEALQKHLEEVTAESARLAEKEWTAAHRSPGVGTINAAPAITIKPVMGGVEITLRYITHAVERYDVRSKLYQTAVELLGAHPAVTSGG
jgi:small-conductance mechanosensitive channel